MISVVGVSLKDRGKIYYFSPNGFTLKKGVTVILETERGLQFGKVETDIFDLPEEKIKQPLKNIIRIASKKDYMDHRKNLKDATKALFDCKRLVRELDLPMQIIDCYYTFTRDQLIFRFLADNRVDFRDLAKQLASIYKTRIELRQVGVRDKAREIGGIAPCGRALCCSRYSYDFDSVSINMAKNQNIALNPNKINGVCGRLLCCLKYEDDVYTQYRSNLPEVGSYVKTEKGEGMVVGLDILKQSYRVDIPKIGIVEIQVEADAS